MLYWFRSFLYCVLITTHFLHTKQTVKSFFFLTLKYNISLNQRKQSQSSEKKKYVFYQNFKIFCNVIFTVGTLPNGECGKRFVILLILLILLYTYNINQHNTYNIYQLIYQLYTYNRNQHKRI